MSGFFLCMLLDTVSEERAARLKRELKRQNRSMRWLAKQVNVTPQALSNWLSGVNRPREDKIWDELDAALTANEGVELGSPRIPVGFPKLRIPYAGTVPASDWGDPLESADFVEVEAEFEHPENFATHVIGESCYPFLQPGDLAIWRADKAPQFGLIVLAQRNTDHAVTVKSLEYDRGLGKPVLKPLNPDFPDVDDTDGWYACARLVAITRKIDGLKRTWSLDSGLRAAHFFLENS